MAARPRRHNVKVPNLYPTYNHKTKTVYWRYKHPITGKFHGLGTDEVEATAVAMEANQRIAEQRVANMVKLSDRIATKKGKSQTVQTFVERYWLIQEERLKTGEVRPNTVKQKKRPVDLLLKHCGMKQIDQVDVRDVAFIMSESIESGNLRMAQVIRTTISDVFREAQHLGEVPAGYNPALATKKPKVRIQRARLDFDEWLVILDKMKDVSIYAKNAMLLALVTGQRLGDVSNMKFSDIWDDHLHIDQGKTGSKVAIPLDIFLKPLSMSLRDVIEQCRDDIETDYLCHYTNKTSHTFKGMQASPDSITTLFQKVRDSTDLKWDGKTPPTFHEQRSLAERLYREQGVDTKALLGHRSQQQTDRYNDNRGKDWVKISIKND